MPFPFDNVAGGFWFLSALSQHPQHKYDLGAGKLLTFPLYRWPWWFQLLVAGFSLLFKANEGTVRECWLQYSYAHAAWEVKCCHHCPECTYQMTSGNWVNISTNIKWHSDCSTNHRGDKPWANNLRVDKAWSGQSKAILMWMIIEWTIFEWTLHAASTKWGKQ